MGVRSRSGWSCCWRSAWRPTCCGSGHNAEKPCKLHRTKHSAARPGTWHQPSTWHPAPAPGTAPKYMIDLSIVIPIHNEEPNLEALCRELTDALSGWGKSYEIIFVDDGSTDKSFSVLETLQHADPRLRVISFRRNFGQTAAFSAGFAHARGRLIVTADSDRENDPADIPSLVKMLVERAL